jgi:hypothetical protein
MVYNFDDQFNKGFDFEKHFFDYLEEKEQQPKWNNLKGFNAEFDISANGFKYEVKVDFYDNKLFPIEIQHYKPDGFKNGWLWVTESDFIVFYKPKYKERFYLRTLELREAYKVSLKNPFRPTYNETFTTINLYISGEELDQLGVIKKIEKYS